MRAEELNVRGEIHVGLVGLDLGWFGFGVCAFRSGKERIAILECVRHETTDCAEICISDLVAEDELTGGEQMRSPK